MEITLSLNGLATGIMVGALYGALGYLKNRQSERFEPKLFIRALVIGAIVGAFTPIDQLTEDKVQNAELYQALSSLGAVTIASKFLPIMTNGVSRSDRKRRRRK